MNAFIRFIALALCSCLFQACGGGTSASASDPAYPPTRLVGEVFAISSEISASDFRTNAGYSGNPSTSRALQASGRKNILDMLFMLHPAGGSDALIAPDAEQKLVDYVREHGDLLTPGVRVLVQDEIFWQLCQGCATPAYLQAKLEALQTAVALVRSYIPQASVGVTVTPYAVFENPLVQDYISLAIALVDWVGTDPYWLGDPRLIDRLHDWSATFPAMARRAHPGVETWFIAQAFKFPDWDSATFDAFIARQLVYAESYDHILFFGWKFASELDSATQGQYFSPQTRALYAKYLK